jgi:hypothetical protein
VSTISGVDAGDSAAAACGKKAAAVAVATAEEVWRRNERRLMGCMGWGQ